MTGNGLQPEKETNKESSETKRTRKIRSDIGPRITERDRKALKWIAQQYAIRLDHLQILLARLTPEGTREPKEAGRLTARRTQDIVDRWVELDLVRVGYFLVGDPAWVWVSSPGLKFLSLGTTMRYYELKPTSDLAHLHACNVARLYLERRRADDQAVSWRSEREIRATQEPRKPGQPIPHAVDAEIETARGLNALEVELSMKTYARLNKILTGLAARPAYRTIWYVVHPDIQKAVAKALESLPESMRRKFLLYDLTELEKQLL